MGKIFFVVTTWNIVVLLPHQFSDHKNEFWGSCGQKEPGGPTSPPLRQSSEYQKSPVLLGLRDL